MIIDTSLDDDIFFLNCQYENAVQETNAVLASLTIGVAA